MKTELKITDHLALVRSKLANERTFLAYFRTFAVLISSGFAIVKIEALEKLRELGYIFLIISVLIILIGTIRFFYVRKKLRKMMK
ncbi:MAG: DUF202 domain-containing protein [Flavobacteriaceae bacterium]|nr:DUF202 domain-containing protein [Flavobacteriaceae bacterium]